MGVLTDDMTRLRDEVLASRGARAAIMRDLARGTKNLTKAVGGMLGAFHTSRARMARQTQAECGTFLAGIETSVNTLRGTVAGLRRQFAADLRGAGKAWRGTVRTPPKPAKPHATRKARKG